MYLSISKCRKPRFICFIPLYVIFIISVWMFYSKSPFFKPQATGSPKYSHDINGTEFTYPLDFRDTVIFLITPTKDRLEQKAELTRLSQTLRLVRNLHWIVIDDALSISDKVEQILRRSGLAYTHMAVRSKNAFIGRGMSQRNLGLWWLRTRFNKNPKVKGVVFFADDDNAYDDRLFDQYVRKVRKVGIWAVGLVGGLKVETPVVTNGTVTGWDVKWNPTRKFATDMAGFAVNLKIILQTNTSFNSSCEKGCFESCFIEQLGISRRDLEPFGFEKKPKEILVWHTKTENSGVGGSDKGFIV